MNYNYWKRAYNIDIIGYKQEIRMEQLTLGAENDNKYAQEKDKGY
jgi:hypothetical protein